MTTSLTLDQPRRDRAGESVPAPSLAELAALTRRLHELEGRHTTRVDGQLVRADCPPGETHCFCGTAEELAARAAQLRARIAVLTGAASGAVTADARREQLNRWHTDDHTNTVARAATDSASDGGWGR